ncbi:hypothetical protein [Streptomyces sp. NPDC047108]|uniref:hypothetical protein n=1 Tax=Streptomyces sp. NPDC047108 TaxID=3155025 RepID=UPI0033F8FDC0
MQADEARPVAAGSGDSPVARPVRTGPRHAAPRKSLLTKLQIPAGKAIALAAMPTAVFVGMGLTPKLAQADEVPGNPFAPGPCVSRSDEPSEKEKEKAEDEKKSPSPSQSPDASTSDEPSDEPSAKKPSPSGDKAEDSDASKTPEPSESAPADESPSPEPSPSESESDNPLDPLGVGEKLKDLFDGDDDEEEEEEPAPAESSSTPSEEPSSETAEPEPSETADKPAETVDKTKDAIKGAADKVGAKVEEVGDEAKKSAEKATEDAKDTAEGATGTKDGKKPFPCPEKDPEALAAADLEQGIPLLPDEAWRLETSKLTLRGLDFKGIVEVKTYSGNVKKVLKFTADETDIKDMHQMVDGPSGTTGHVKAAEGSTSKLRGGTVTMYTEELSGKLFGLIPVTFSPDSPPPLNVPFAIFTDAKVKQAGQFGGTLTVPGIQQFSTK